MRISACLLASGFIFASLYIILYARENKYKNKFISLLTSDQLDKYKKIHNERTKIYLQGQVLGSVFALFYLYLYGTRKYSVCYFALITYILCIAYYSLTPKTLNMQDHLTTQEQKRLYKKYCMQMKSQYIFGFILGMVGYIFLARAINSFMC